MYIVLFLGPGGESTNFVVNGGGIDDFLVLYFRSKWLNKHWFILGSNKIWRTYIEVEKDIPYSKLSISHHDGSHYLEVRQVSLFFLCDLVF